MNPLQEWMNNYTSGPGVWKWSHYLDVYHRHLAPFRGKPVTIVEIGVYSGGSLRMWRDYLGETARVVGVDIQPACRRYATEWAPVFIGDQGDRDFWAYFKTQVTPINIVVDDGSHDPNDQLTTFRELFPAISPGGVYICEDLLNDRNLDFGKHLSQTCLALHENVDIHATDMLAMGLTDLQRSVRAVHTYPHIVVVEKWEDAPARFEAPGRGTDWVWSQPDWEP